MSETIKPDHDSAGDPAHGADTVAFGERLAQSDQFSALFREGMALIEETASYLDGQGRTDSRLLSRAATMAYTSTTMSLTTRLMQLASWLMLQRAVNENEITREQARVDQHRVKLSSLSSSPPGLADELPEALLSLIERSFRLQTRIIHLDRLLDETAPSEPQSRDVALQIERLSNAFGAARKG